MLCVAWWALQRLTESFALRLSIAPPPGRALRQAPPTIAVTVQGKGSEILKLRNIPRTISKTVPDTLTGSLWRLDLSPRGRPPPQGGGGGAGGGHPPPGRGHGGGAAPRRRVG